MKNGFLYIATLAMIASGYMHLKNRPDVATRLVLASIASLAFRITFQLDEAKK